MLESATRRLRADRSRQTRDTPTKATIGGIDLANATIGISGGISQNATHTLDKTHQQDILQLERCMSET